MTHSIVFRSYGACPNYLGSPLSINILSLRDCSSLNPKRRTSLIITQACRGMSGGDVLSPDLPRMRRSYKVTILDDDQPAY